MIDVVYFPKKCPHCQTVLTVIEKMYWKWMQCDNDLCPDFVPEDNTGGEHRFYYAESGR